MGAILWEKQSGQVRTVLAVYRKRDGRVTLHFILDTDHLAAATVSQTINTSFVARNNLTCRQCNGRLARKVLSFSKDLTWLEKPLWLSLAY